MQRIFYTRSNYYLTSRVNQRKQKFLNIYIFLILVLIAFYYDSAHAGTCIRTELHHARVNTLEFRVVNDSCDVLAKEAFVKIFARDNDSDFTLIFEYDPVDFGEPPTISLSTNHNLLVSVNAVAQIIFQKRSIGSYPILYNVGKIIEPQKP